MGHDKLKKWKKGSLTIEAVYLLPFLFLCIFVLLVLLLCLHDRCTLTAAAAELAGKGEQQKYRAAERLENELYLGGVEAAKERLILMQPEEIEASVGKNQVWVYFEMSTPMLGGIRMQAEEQAARRNPCDEIQRFRKGKEAAGV